MDQGPEILPRAAEAPDALPSERSLTLGDGTQLHLEEHAPAGQARALVVMLHGFAVHSAPYRRVAAELARAGLQVTAFDTRGHGRSTGRRGYVRRFQHFQDDLHAVVEAVRASRPGLPIAVLGHSHGATVALDYALAGRSPLFALVLASPFLALKMKVPAWKTRMAGVMGRLWPTLQLANEVRAEDSTRDPVYRALFADDPLAHHVATPRWFNEIRAAQAHILGCAGALSVPTFMALAGDDRIVQSEVSRSFAAAAGSIVEVREYADAFHELFLEQDWRRIVNDVASWLVARLPAPYT